MQKGKYKQDIIHRFNELGYNVNFRLLTASSYGVPQSRKRVFFIGLRKDIFENEFFNFDNLPTQNIVSTKEAMSDLPEAISSNDHIEYSKPPTNNFQKLMRVNSEGVFNHQITNHTAQTKEIIAQVPDGGGIKDLPEELYKVRNYNNAFRRMNSKLPSNTIDCGHRNYFHYEKQSTYGKRKCKNTKFS